MEQITAMKITGLELVNFRNHIKPERFNFGDLSYISGHNGTGKTSIAHSICYALYGVSYYGEMKIERLMNEDSQCTQVKLDFIDQNGKSHTLSRVRKGDKTDVFLDGYTVRKGEIERMFCEKDVFLSMFNPSYLVERMGDSGRELIIKNLVPVEPDAVLGQMSEGQRNAIDGFDLKGRSVEQTIKELNAEIRRAEQQHAILEGNVQEIRNNQILSESKLGELWTEERELKTKIEALKQRQFEGIELSELEIQKDVLLGRLSEFGYSEPQELTDLREKLAEVRRRQYVSDYTTVIAEAKAELNIHSKRHKELGERIKNLKPGTNCPFCCAAITEENISSVTAAIKEEMTRIAAIGNGVASRGREAVMLDNKAKETFEQFKRDDIEKLEGEIAEFESKIAPIDSSDIRSQIEEIEAKQKYGNLTAEEYSELSCLKSELVGISAQIKNLTELSDEKRLEEATAQQQSFDEQIEKYEKAVDALKEYLCKRTELATAGLKMPNVSIRLFDIARTTGEVKPAFKFEYKGREYNTLSLSEKTLAGVEISAMVRRIVGIDCPICIDNTESVAAFNDVEMPSQTILLRFVKGQPLSVRSKNNFTVVSGAELKKAS